MAHIGLTHFNVSKNLKELSDVIKQTEDILTSNRTTSRKRVLATLVMEESIVKLAEASHDDKPIRVSVRRFLRKTTINIMAKGEEIDFARILAGGNNDELLDEYGVETGEAISNIILRANSQDIRYSHFKGINLVTILVAKNNNSSLVDTVSAIVLSVLLGTVLRLALPASAEVALAENLFSPLYRIFLNAVMMVMTPLVFFSLANCISGFSNLKELGRSGLKVFVCYLVTTMFAIGISYGISALVHPGEGVVLDIYSGEAYAGELPDVSILETLINIVPSNFVTPFSTAAMLQVLFLAMVIGIAAGTLGEYSDKIRSAIAAADALFSKITSYIIKFMPLAVFGSFTSMILTTNMEAFKAVSSWAIAILACVACMLLIYSFLLWAIGGLNPLTFSRKYLKVPLAAFSTCSSSATMPASMECCHKLGISPVIYKFSIPLGASINMDGTSIFFVVSTLFLAAGTGVIIPIGTTVSFIATVILLSMAAPGVPGAAIACLAMLLSIVGIPTECMAIIIGVTPLIEPFLTAINVVGDGVVTTLVAKSEKSLDLGVFNRR